MALRIIVHEPDAVLRQVAKKVTKITPNVQKLLNDMADTMYDARGIGLAAPQIGILKRIIVVDIDDGQGLIEMINPEIIAAEGEQIRAEGCLSIPGLRGDVRRYQNITVKGLHRNACEVTVEATDLLARVFQHEIDHLNGILFTDIAENVREVLHEAEDKQ